MKKIGIINYQYSNHNYGAVLQAAALQFYIEDKIKLNAEHINYIPEAIVSNWRTRTKALLIKVLMLLGLREKKLVHDIVGNSEIFEQFRNQWLPRSEKTYRSSRELEAEDFDYSHVVVGSDQVWRPSYAGGDPLIYFLSFLNSKIKRVAYAASFGKDTWELDAVSTQKIAREVQKFSSMSVRESTAVNICNKEFGVHAQQVLDPTLLVGRGFFDNIIEESNAKFMGGIVYYQLDIDEQFECFIKSAEHVLNCQSKNIYMDTNFGRKQYFSVPDWLKHIKNANFVITDSFHCVCFSILFEKPFIYYPSSTRGLTRLESLLGALGLGHHIYNDSESVNDFIFKVNKIEYKEVLRKLKELRIKSEDFLLSALTR